METKKELIENLKKDIAMLEMQADAVVSLYPQFK